MSNSVRTKRSRKMLLGVAAIGAGTAIAGCSSSSSEPTTQADAGSDAAKIAIGGPPANADASADVMTITTGTQPEMVDAGSDGD